MLTRLVSELSRRRVFRGAATYIIVAWIALRVVDAVTDPLDSIRRLAFLWAVGLFPLVVAFSWVFQVTPGEVHREHHGGAAPPRTGLGRVLDLAVFAAVALIVVVEIVRHLLAAA
jgi:hypothetical protein